MDGELIPLEHVAGAVDQLVMEIRGKLLLLRANLTKRRMAKARRTEADEREIIEALEDLAAFDPGGG